MAGAQNDIIDIQDKVSDLETLTEFLLAEQSLQDQRIFALEQGSVSTQEDIEGEHQLTLGHKLISFVLGRKHFIWSMVQWKKWAVHINLHFRSPGYHSHSGQQGVYTWTVFSGQHHWARRCSNWPWWRYWRFFPLHFVNNCILLLCCCSERCKVVLGQTMIQAGPDLCFTPTSHQLSQDQSKPPNWYATPHWCATTPWKVPPPLMCHPLVKCQPPMDSSTPHGKFHPHGV